MLICANTHQLAGGYFEYRDLGPVVLKGWAEPIPAWQVLRTSGVESRFEAMHKTKLPPLFGSKRRGWPQRYLKHLKLIKSYQ